MLNLFVVVLLLDVLRVVQVLDGLKGIRRRVRVALVSVANEFYANTFVALNFKILGDSFQYCRMA